jgi:hypothetical protein
MERKGRENDGIAVHDEHDQTKWAGKNGMGDSQLKGLLSHCVNESRVVSIKQPLMLQSPQTPFSSQSPQMGMTQYHHERRSTPPVYSKSFATSRKRKATETINNTTATTTKQLRGIPAVFIRPFPGRTRTRPSVIGRISSTNSSV